MFDFDVVTKCFLRLIRNIFDIVIRHTESEKKFIYSYHKTEIEEMYAS